ncbi:MAG: hypothetical protein Q8N05_02050 [Bacteroidota bacterium]|nr:hypothetical protein [Bacteroidota bacterium]
MEIVKSIAHLKELSEIDGFAEFKMILAGGLCHSSKRICYYADSKTFDVHNEIDDTWNEGITEEELDSQTMIPLAIERGAFFYCGYQLNKRDPKKPYSLHLD